MREGYRSDTSSVRTASAVLVSLPAVPPAAFGLAGCAAFGRAKRGSSEARHFAHPSGEGSFTRSTAGRQAVRSTAHRRLRTKFANTSLPHYVRSSLKNRWSLRDSPLRSPHYVRSFTRRGGRALRASLYSVERRETSSRSTE